MSEYEVNKPISFSDIANSNQEDTTALRLWDKAWKIMSADKKLLRIHDYGGSTYFVSTLVSTTSGERYAVASLAHKGKPTKTLYIVVNERFDKLVLINKEGRTPPLHLDSDYTQPVAVGDIETHLDTLVREVNRLTEQRKGKLRKKIVSGANSVWDSVDEYGGYVGAFVAMVVVIGGGGYGLAYAASGNQRFAERFDTEHSSYVLQGEQLMLGQERLLTSTPQDTSVNLPKSPDGEVHDRPRWVSISAGTCEIASTIEDIGYIDGTQKLIASTSAPSDIVRVRVAKDGLVDICAHNPEGRSSDHQQDYTVSLQAVPLTPQ